MSTFLRSIRFGRSWVLPGVLGALLLVAVTGGAVAAIETDTVTSYWQGLWWSISLITTVGFVGALANKTKELARKEPSDGYSYV